MTTDDIKPEYRLCLMKAAIHRWGGPDNLGCVPVDIISSETGDTYTILDYLDYPTDGVRIPVTASQVISDPTSSSWRKKTYGSFSFWHPEFPVGDRFWIRFIDSSLEFGYFGDTDETTVRRLIKSELTAHAEEDYKGLPDHIRELCEKALKKLEEYNLTS